MSVRSREPHACSLVEDVLLSRGSVQLRATGLSMLPALWPGDVLTIQSQDFHHIEAGDVVLYGREGRLFLHRVIGRIGDGSELALRTRGDCMSEDDPPVRREELLGRVSDIRRGGRTLPLERRRTPAARSLAWLLCHCDFLLRLVLRLRCAGLGRDVNTSADRLTASS